MPSDIHEAANTTKEGWIAWFCPLKLYRHYSGCRIWSGLLYRNYIKLYVSFCAARPGFVAYLFVVQYTTAVLYRCFYIRFVLPLIQTSTENHEHLFLYLFTKREYDPNSLGQPTVKRTKQKISVNSALKKKSASATTFGLPSALHFSGKIGYGSA